MTTSAPKEDEDAKVDFNMLFSLRKPQHVGAGLVSAGKSVAKGVLAGAVGLVAAPAVGAAQEGFKGFAKGAAAGVAGAVLLPVTGVAVGTAQVFRGIANTPEAIMESNKGKVWDKGTRSWIGDPGTALIFDADGTAAPFRPFHSTDNVDDYYGLLGVHKTASQEEIKRAYYLAARRQHPDKNPGDPAAHERFQALSQAYQVLGSEELRKRYDAHGTQGLDVNFVDGAEFFGALFGSDRFEHLVGELMLAAAARAGPDLTAEKMKRMQGGREAKLVVNLGALLKRYVEGDEQGFLMAMEQEARQLATVSYGQPMLKAIGKVYETQAQIELGGMFEGSFLALRAQGRNIKSQFKAASLAIKVMQVQQNIGRLEAEADKVQRLVDEELRRTTSESAGTVPDGSTDGNDELPFGVKGSSGMSSTSQPSISNHHDANVPVMTREELAAAAMAAHAERVKAEEASLPLMLDAMWAANILDIESTLKKVCRQVLKTGGVSVSGTAGENSGGKGEDGGLSKAHRRRLAQGLLELGKIFRKHGSVVQSDVQSEGSGSNNSQHGRDTTTSAKEKVEAAMMRVAEKKMENNDNASASHW